MAREESISLEVQESVCRQYAERQGHTVVGVFKDPGISGRTFKRPGVRDAMQAIEDGKAEVIILWRWSRLSRNRLDWAVAVDKVESLGGSIESATEPVDTATASGRFARGVLAEMAAFESEKIGETWKETHTRRVQNGLPHHGRPRLGYTYSKDTGYTVDPVAGSVLRDMYLDYIAGTGMRELTERSIAHGGPSDTSSVRRYLDSGFGAGKVVYRKELHPGAHEGVITDLEFKAYQRARKARSNGQRGERSPHAYTGLVVCECGARMAGNTTSAKGRPLHRYLCQAYNRLAKGDGHTNSVIASRLDSAVLDFLSGIASEVNALTVGHRAGVKRRTADPRPKLREGISKASARLDALTLKYVDGEVDKETYDRLTSRLKDEKADLEERLDALDAQVQAPPVRLAADLLREWDRMPVEFKRQILRAIIARIEVGRGGNRWNPSEIRVIPVWEDQSR